MAVKKLIVSPLIVSVLLLAAAFVPAAAADPNSGWIAARYTAAADETLSAVEFVTGAPDLSYSIRVYSGLLEGNPAGLLAAQEGRAAEPGFYSVRLLTPLKLRRGDTFSVALVLSGAAKGGAYFGAAPRLEMGSAYATETAEWVGASVDGSSYGPTAASTPFTIRVWRSVQPEATTITAFTASPQIVAGAAMTFTFSATGTNAGESLAWTLKFGDGTADATGTGASPIVDSTVSHTYDLAGTYTATLYVVDTVDNTRAQASLTIVAAIPVEASADPTCGLAALNVCFTGSATHATEPFTWLWVFGDGQSSQSQNPCHAFVQCGVYTAILTVTDAVGATGTSDVIEIRVSTPLVVTATANPTDGIPPTVVNFCAAVTGCLPDEEYIIAWDFGDGSTVTSNDLCQQHAYNEVGAYDATVTATDTCGNTGTLVTPLTVTVHESPWIRIVSPASGSTVRTPLNIQAAIMVEEGVTITRVDFFISDVLIDIVTAPPWATSYDASGLHGTYTLTARVTDSQGRSTLSDAVSVLFDNPVLDGRVDSGSDPFRLKVYGNWFERGCYIKINGQPIPRTVRKGQTLAVAKGGTALKALVPEGVPVVVTIHNPDGGASAGITFTR
jgi:PKD repeat protein